jgi:peptidoglycan-N-acetylglucosamine deacetylase
VKFLYNPFKRKYQPKNKDRDLCLWQFFLRPLERNKFSGTAFLAILLAVFVIFNIIISEELQSKKNFSSHATANDNSPVPNYFPTQQELLKQKFSFLQEIKQINSSQKIVALTFDDGPSPVTLEVLEILKEKQVPATFFVIGKWVDRHPDVLQKNQFQGHEIGNHSNTHKNLKDLSETEITQEIMTTQNKVYRLTGRKPKYLRMPYGTYNDEFFKLNHQTLNLYLIGWSSDPQDWKKQSTAKIMETISNEVESGAIIVLHDGPPELDRSQTLEILPQIIDQLQEEGYKFVSLTDLLLAEEENRIEIRDINLASEKNHKEINDSDVITPNRM